MPESSILLVDDDSDALVSLIRALKGSGISAPIHAAGNAVTGLEILKADKPAVAVIDLSLDPQSGVESGFSLLGEIQSIDSTCRVIVLTGHSGTEQGIRALKSGAAHFLEKPANISLLATLIEDSIKQSRLLRAYTELKVSNSLDSLLIGQSQQMQSVKQQISYAAQTNQAVLITGETGTGKGLCALAIHRLSKRSNKSFVRYQTTYSTADLVGSELFGHLKGAFTGASEARTGLLSEADGGTVFLDEIDMLPLESQVALLGVLQDKEFRPIGANKPVQSNFRIICASNQEIETCLKEGKLRTDFFHRVAHFRIHLPPLRERRNDICLIAQAAIDRLQEKEGISTRLIEPEAQTALENYNWPGNVRELEALIEGAAYRAHLAGRGSIGIEDLVFPGQASEKSITSFHEQVEAFKRELVQTALERNGNNQVQAAKALGLDRSSLRRIITDQN